MEDSTVQSTQPITVREDHQQEMKGPDKTMYDKAVLCRNSQSEVKVGTAEEVMYQQNGSRLPGEAKIKSRASGGACSVQELPGEGNEHTNQRI